MEQPLGHCPRKKYMISGPLFWKSGLFEQDKRLARQNSANSCYIAKIKPNNILQQILMTKGCIKWNVILGSHRAVSSGSWHMGRLKPHSDSGWRSFSAKSEQLVLFQYLSTYLLSAALKELYHKAIRNYFFCCQDNYGPNQQNKSLVFSDISF